MDVAEIDLRSDTVTKPSKAMLKAMLNARLGDDVFNEDPTVIELEAKAAKILGKEAGLFMPSGTMANQVAIKSITNPPGELICERNSHIYLYEGGGISFHSGLSAKLINGDRGRVSSANVANAINPEHDYFPTTQLVSIENTHNRGGGSVYSKTEVEAIYQVIKDKPINFHLDGARLFNAVIASDYSAKEFCEYFDTVSICLSKGLGAPVGSVIASSEEIIRRARKLRKLMGGGMRQVGILAAAGIYALDNNIERLAEDHRNAKKIESALSGMNYISELIPVSTNIIVFELKDKVSVELFINELKRNKVLAVPFGVNGVRMVTHLDVDSEKVDLVCSVLQNIII